MKLFLKTRDYAVSNEEFELLHNEELDMLVTSPQPDDLSRYYESESYISHTDANKTFVDKIYQLVKKYSLRRKLSLVNSYSNKKRTLLDIGAGTGDFLLAAQNNGWSIMGVEPNCDARTRSQEKEISLISDMESLPRTKFGVITLWHVLEHLADLEDQILKIVWHLEDAGVLIIAVPNYKSYDANYYQNVWAAYDVPRHLWHFSRTSIEKLFDKHGLQLIKTKPMLFDAFYVSLLSERYKSGKTSFSTFPRAILRGFCSNVSAWRSKEYSSIIYVLKKS